jgi:hypothetical protein
MFGKFISLRGLLVKAVAPMALGALALILTAANASAQASCKTVIGHYVEHAVTENCNSPAGLCIAGEYSGIIKGNFEGAATTLAPTQDMPPTGVLLFTSDSTIHATVMGKSGDLIIKNAGAFYSTGNGEIVDLQVITEGTGELAGARGALRASGTFDFATGMGESEYIGTICLP